MNKLVGAYSSSEENDSESEKKLNQKPEESQTKATEAEEIPKQITA